MKKRINMAPKPSQRFLIRTTNEVGTVIVSVETEISEHEFNRDVLTVDTTIYKGGKRYSFTKPKYQRGGIVPNTEKMAASLRAELNRLKSEYKKNPTRFYEQTIVM